MNELKLFMVRWGELISTLFVVCGLVTFIIGYLEPYLFIVGAGVFIFGIMILAYSCAESMNGLYK